CREVCRVVDVQLEHLGSRVESPGAALGQGEAAAEAGEEDFRAFLLRQLGHAEGDRLRREHAGDEQPLTFEQHEPASRESFGSRALSPLQTMLMCEWLGGRKV